MPAWSIASAAANTRRWLRAPAGSPDPPRASSQSCAAAARRQPAAPVQWQSPPPPAPSAAAHVLRPPSRCGRLPSACAFTLVRRAANAGASPHTSPVTTAQQQRKSHHRPSSADLVHPRQAFRQQAAAHAATPAPPVPAPATHRSRSAPGSPELPAAAAPPPRAPSASRTAISRCRRIARTSINPARFTHAINSTTATARNSVRNSGRVWSTVSSCSGRTSALMCSVRHHRRIVAHNLLRHPLRIALRLLAVTPGFSRPTIW